MCSALLLQWQKQISGHSPFYYFLFFFIFCVFFLFVQWNALDLNEVVYSGSIFFLSLSLSSFFFFSFARLAFPIHIFIFLFGVFMLLFVFLSCWQFLLVDSSKKHNIIYGILFLLAYIQWKYIFSYYIEEERKEKKNG